MRDSENILKMDTEFDSLTGGKGKQLKFWEKIAINSNFSIKIRKDRSVFGTKPQFCNFFFK